MDQIRPRPPGGDEFPQPGDQDWRSSCRTFADTWSGGGEGGGGGAGEVLFNGQRFDKLGSRGMREYRSQVGYVQQDPYGALPSFMNVHRILSEPLLINGVASKDERERQIRQALQEVKLVPVAEFLPKFPHMLSGDQQQRVVIARAMILEPKLLVADEPVSMLDASVRVEILELLRGLQRAHDLGVIYITHDLSTVRYFTERIFVMYGAKLVEKAGVNEFLHNTLHPYSQALLAAIPDPDPENATTFREVPSGEPPSLLHPPSGCRFHPRCTWATEACQHLEPELRQSGSTSWVACWHPLS